jgi:hypothetical protein
MLVVMMSEGPGEGRSLLGGRTDQDETRLLIAVPLASDESSLGLMKNVPQRD